MLVRTRFQCPSASMTLRSLLKRRNTSLWIGLGLAVVAHGVLTQLQGLTEKQNAPKPLTTRFVKRRPRLTKPLEMRKRPQPRMRRIQRQMVSVRARIHEGRATSGTETFVLVRRLARPRASVSRYAGVAAARIEPQAVAGMIEGQKEARNVMDTSLEMLDVEALDIGRYHALVIQDPTDKRNVRGFFRLKYAYSECMKERDWHQMEDRMVHGVVALIEAMNQYTNIRSSFEGRIRFASAELMKTPWVFSLVMFPFQFPDEEAAHVGTYLASGGFLLCDAFIHGVYPKTPYEKRPPLCLVSARSNFERALATQGLECGRDWDWEILANDHPLLHCYFDFDGPPASPLDSEVVLSGRLEGLHFDGRWPLVICQKGFQHYWDDPRYPQLRSERMLQFGINTIIFALTQEGSITHRLMDSVR